MKNLSIILLLATLVSCNKKLTEGPHVIKDVKGSYVKFYDLRRWYYIQAKVKKDQVLFMLINKNKVVTFKPNR